MHYQSTVGREKISRPLDPVVYRTKASNLLKYDYIKLGAMRNGETYVLMTLDDPLDHWWFFAFPKPGRNAASAIID